MPLHRERSLCPYTCHIRKHTTDLARETLYVCARKKNTIVFYELKYMGIQERTKEAQRARDRARTFTYMHTYMHTYIQERTKEAERSRKEALDALRRLTEENDKLQVHTYFHA